MKIRWWGHACFRILTDEGVTVITDPYDLKVGYPQITDSPDVVTVSHSHFDHNAVSELPGSPQVVSSSGKHRAHNVSILGIESYHDDSQGSIRGTNLIFVLEASGYRIAHLGDLGEPLSDEQRQSLGAVDVLLVPVGGHFTIDAALAYQIVGELDPGIVIPMHYKTEAIDFPIAPVSEFIKMFPDEKVMAVDGEELVIDSVPQNQMVYILPHAQGK